MTASIPSNQPRHLSADQLRAGLDDILSAPANDGEVLGIVVRPAKGERLEPQACRVTAAGGFDGDHWAKGCWKSLPDGQPDPDVQVCIMNARCINLLADGARHRWAAAGDNLFVDMDLSPDNLAPGQRIAVGTALLEITAEPHRGCKMFAERYGHDACVFVNTGPGRRYNLRGIYARVVSDGVISVGDRLKKV